VKRETRQRVWICARAIAVGWVVLVAITYLIERPLLRWTGPMLEGSWLPTAELALDCCAFAATGWVIGRFSRDAVLIALLAFAATLAWRDFTPLLPVNVPWLVRSAVNAFSDSRYFAGFVTTAATHAILFGSLFAGGLLTRRAQKPPSIVGCFPKDARRDR
jgi:hypothetical protein